MASGPVFSFVWISSDFESTLPCNTDTGAPDFEQWKYDTVLALIYSNVILNKLWTLLFFEYNQKQVALVDCVILLLSAVTITIMLGVFQKWWSMALFIPYCIWLVVATYLNTRAVISENSEGVSKS
jgi:tryptophan-rich sensory protein